MSKTRILVVDDNPTNLKLASELLTWSGYEIAQAATAEQAEASIKAQPPELILMDLALPGMDGLTLTQKLKADAATQHIRIVALTAFAMKGDEERARAAGCDGYLAKPIDTRQFANQVAAWLEARDAP